MVQVSKLGANASTYWTRQPVARVDGGLDNEEALAMDFLGLFVQSINQFASARLIVHGVPNSAPG